MKGTGALELAVSAEYARIESGVGLDRTVLAIYCMCAAMSTLCQICYAGYYNPCLQCGALVIELAFEGNPVSLSTVR